jgi:4a-hydroxytetrahydrobiopterin dehydratase
MKKDPNSIAKNALVNLLVFPGLGSLRAGRWVAGMGQLVLVLSGTAMGLIWFFKELSQYYGLMGSLQDGAGDEKPKAVAWIGEIGAVLFVISWAWAGVTSISLFQEASKEASKASAPPPPVLTMTKKNPNDAKIQAALATLPNWKRNGQIISRTYEFEDFPDAMKFVNNVAVLAEQAQHHPDIDVRWNKVTLALTTHDAGGLTEKDFALARACDAKLLG